jgi:hypothetical protein
VDRAALESGTAQSLIQTSAEAIRFPAGSPMRQWASCAKDFRR